MITVVLEGSTLGFICSHELNLFKDIPFPFDFLYLTSVYFRFVNSFTHASHDRYSSLKKFITHMRMNKYS